MLLFCLDKQQNIAYNIGERQQSVAFDTKTKKGKSR